MSPAKKPRKALDDITAELDGNTNRKRESSEPPAGETENLEAKADAGGTKFGGSSNPSNQSIPKQAKGNLMSRLMETPEKEATVRITVDLPKSMHQKLSMLSARTGKKKAEIVRMLLDNVLDTDLLDDA